MPQQLPLHYQKALQKAKHHQQKMRLLSMLAATGNRLSSTATEPAEGFIIADRAYS